MFSICMAVGFACTEKCWSWPMRITSYYTRILFAILYHIFFCLFSLQHFYSYFYTTFRGYRKFRIWWRTKYWYSLWMPIKLISKTIISVCCRMEIKWMQNIWANDRLQSGLDCANKFAVSSIHICILIGQPNTQRMPNYCDGKFGWMTIKLLRFPFHIHNAYSVYAQTITESIVACVSLYCVKMIRTNDSMSNNSHYYSCSCDCYNWTFFLLVKLCSIKSLLAGKIELFLSRTWNSINVSWSHSQVSLSNRIAMRSMSLSFVRNGHVDIVKSRSHLRITNDGVIIYLSCATFSIPFPCHFFFGMVKDARDPLLSLHFANGQLNKIDHPSDSILDYIILVVRVCCSCVVCVCAPNWPSPSVVRMCLPIIVSFFPFCLPALLNSNMPIKSRICWEIVRKVSTLLLYWFIYLFLCCWFCCCWFSRQNKTNNARCFQVHSKNFVNWTNQHVSQQYGHCRRTATETSATEEHF